MRHADTLWTRNETARAVVAALAEAGIVEYDNGEPQTPATMEFANDLPWRYYQSTGEEDRPIAFVAPIGRGRAAVVILGAGRSEFSVETPTAGYERTKRVVAALDFPIEPETLFAGAGEIVDIVERTLNGETVRTIAFERRGGGSELWVENPDNGLAAVRLVRFPLVVDRLALRKAEERLSDALLLAQWEREDFEAEARYEADQAAQAREIRDREEYENEVLEERGA